jgi:hypothetical protein
MRLRYKHNRQNIVRCCVGPIGLVADHTAGAVVATIVAVGFLILPFRIVSNCEAQSASRMASIAQKKPVGRFSIEKPTEKAPSFAMHCSFPLRLQWGIQRGEGSMNTAPFPAGQHHAQA